MVPRVFGFLSIIRTQLLTAFRTQPAPEAVTPLKDELVEFWIRNVELVLSWQL